MNYAEHDGLGWAAEGWCDSRSALTRAHEIVEEALERASAGISEEFPEARDDPELFFDAHYHLVNEPGAVVRAGLFCEAVTNFEYALLRFCVVATPLISDLGYSMAAEDPRDLTKNRLRHLGTLAGSSFVDVQDLHEILLLRNVVTHAASETVTVELRPGGPKRQLVIEKWAVAHPELIAIVGFSIRLRREFLPHVVGVIDRLVAAIVEALKARAQRKGTA